MKGFVDNGGRALITVELRKSVRGDSTSIDVWVDYRNLRIQLTPVPKGSG